MPLVDNAPRLLPGDEVCIECGVLECMERYLNASYTHFYRYAWVQRKILTYQTRTMHTPMRNHYVLQANVRDNHFPISFNALPVGMSSLDKRIINKCDLGLGKNS
jgi:hypothetical protein